MYDSNFYVSDVKLFEYGRNWLACQDLGFGQDFVSMHKEGRKDKNLDP